MTTAADTLRAIEARTEHAIREELRLMTHQIIALRARLALDSRASADMLRLELDPPERDQPAPAGEDGLAALPVPPLTVTVFESPLPKAYRVFFYERDYGDLADVLTVNSFEAGVQLVRDRLGPDRNHAISAAWFRHEGEMAVATIQGTVLARVEADDSDSPTPRPEVRDACSALRTGDASQIERLFGRLLEAG